MSIHEVLSVPDEPQNLLDGLLNPPMDVKEYPGSYVFLVDTPGLKYTDIKVEVEEEKVLCISGERKRNDQEQNIEGTYIHMERSFGKFTRKLILPAHCKWSADRHRS